MAAIRPPRVFCDTSVLFGRSRFEVVRRCSADPPQIVGLWSEWVIGELCYGLAWQWAESKGMSASERDRMASAARRMLRVLVQHLEMVSLHDVISIESPDWLADEADLPILAGAMAGGSDVLLTTDGGLLRRSGGRWGSLEINTPARFFARLDAGPAATP